LKKDKNIFKNIFQSAMKLHSGYLILHHIYKGSIAEKPEVSRRNFKMYYIMKKFDVYLMENVQGGANVDWANFLCGTAVTGLFTAAAIGCGTPVTWIAFGLGAGVSLVACNDW